MCKEGGLTLTSLLAELQMSRLLGLDSKDTLHCHTQIFSHLFSPEQLRDH